MKPKNSVASHFNTAYERLNDEQKKAVDAIHGTVMVIAGPGTGKTEVLTMRIANIIEKTGTAPEKILALTFTESGVASMRKRLADLIGTPAYRVGLSTFHGFANSVIRNYPDKFPEIIGSASITDVDQIRILRDIIDATPLQDLKPFGDRYYYLKSVLGKIGELKKEGVTPETFKKLVDQQQHAVETINDLYYESGAHKGKMKGKYKDEVKHAARNAEVFTVYKKYQEALRAGKQYDYSDMIMFVMKALEEDESLRLTLQEMYSYFLVDEHQDTNNAQNRIVELLAAHVNDDGSTENSPNLFVVGDEKQAIYRFQGASIENFHHFKTLYKDITIIPLLNNYRSTQAILDAAHAISPRDEMLMAKAGHPEVTAALAELSSPDGEYFFVAKKIKELIKNGIPADDIAILYRENRDAAPLAIMLEREGIPFNIESDQDILADEDIKKLLKILKAVQHFGTPSYLFEALHVDFLNIPPLDIYKLFSLANKKRINAYDVLADGSLLNEAGIAPTTQTKLQKLSTHLSDWKRASENYGATRAFEIIVRESGFLIAIMGASAASEKIAKLHAFFEALKELVEARKNYTLKDFFNHLDLIEEQGVSMKGSDAFHSPDRVRLMTAHKSKGQEFDYVFIINALDGKWGSRHRREHIVLPKGVYPMSEAEKTEDETQADSDNDERNLFYVALTRARKEIYITYSQNDRQGHEQLPTQFVHELKDEHLALVDVTSYEKDFAEHREDEFSPVVASMPDIEDKKFLNALFAEQGLSVTALDNYLECPWHYFYVNLIHVPEAPNKHLMFGNAVHESLKLYFDALNANTVMVQDPKAGRNFLIENFVTALTHQPIEERDFEETLQKGKTSLGAWYDNYHSSWVRKTQNEIRIAGIQLEDGTSINGKLDKIEILDARGKVNVADYKTGEWKTRNAIEGKTKSSSGNYKRQLVFYHLLLDKSAKFSMVSGEIDFIEPDDNGKFHKEQFVIEADEIQELEKTIMEVAEQIRSLAFWNTTCDNEDCRYCGLRKLSTR